MQDCKMCGWRARKRTVHVPYNGKTIGWIASAVEGVEGVESVERDERSDGTCALLA